MFGSSDFLKQDNLDQTSKFNAPVKPRRSSIYAGAERVPVKNDEAALDEIEYLQKLQRSMQGYFSQKKQSVDTTPGLKETKTTPTPSNLKEIKTVARREPVFVTKSNANKKQSQTAVMQKTTISERPKFQQAKQVTTKPESRSHAHKPPRNRYGLSKAHELERQISNTVKKTDQRSIHVVERKPTGTVQQRFALRSKSREDPTKKQIVKKPFSKLPSLPNLKSNREESKLAFKTEKTLSSRASLEAFKYKKEADENESPHDQVKVCDKKTLADDKNEGKALKEGPKQEKKDLELGENEDIIYEIKDEEEKGTKIDESDIKKGAILQSALTKILALQDVDQLKALEEFLEKLE